MVILELIDILKNINNTLVNSQTADFPSVKSGIHPGKRLFGLDLLSSKVI